MKDRLTDGCPSEKANAPKRSHCLDERTATSSAGHAPTRLTPTPGLHGSSTGSQDRTPTPPALNPSRSEGGRSTWGRCLAVSAMFLGHDRSDVAAVDSASA
jgi:hypothetical protein